MPYKPSKRSNSRAKRDPSPHTRKRQGPPHHDTGNNPQNHREADNVHDDRPKIVESALFEAALGVHAGEEMFETESPVFANEFFFGDEVFQLSGMPEGVDVDVDLIGALAVGSMGPAESVVAHDPAAGGEQFLAFGNRYFVGAFKAFGP